MSAYTIMIADDEEVNHELLGGYLELAGYRIEHVYDGAAVLQRVREASPDLLLLDIQMPELDGFQTLEALRREPAGSDLPVLFVTTLDRVNLKVKGLELGAEDYIVKPFQKAELLARIKTVLRRTRRERPADGTLHGQLADLGLAELLQTLELGRKTACIHLPEMDGAILLSGGTFCTARQGARRGEEALLRLFYLHHGRFTVDFTGVAEATPTHSVQFVLMETARQIDEIRRLLAALPPGQPLLTTSAEASSVTFPAALRLQLPLALTDLLLALPGDLAANAALVAAAYGAGELAVAG